MSIRLDYSNVMDFIGTQEIEQAMGDYQRARKTVLSGDGPGSDYLGWLRLPDTVDTGLIDDIVETAGRIRQDTDLFITVGIGGSYLGARAGIEALLPEFVSLQKSPQVVFAGHSISSRYLGALLEMMKGRRVSVNVISKSGTTTEPALAFRLIRRQMMEQYGEAEASRRIIATTDARSGALRRLAEEQNLKTYVIPDDVGGRFSVLTPVGLLPLAVAGIDIKAMMEGACQGTALYRDLEAPGDNPSSMYAIIRNILYRKGKTIEVLSNFEPRLHYFSEWFKQLFGESEGKNNRGIFPASCDFSTDLHSMGQWIQEGPRSIFETFLQITEGVSSLKPGHDRDNLDNLNYLADMPLEEINRQALYGTRLAHLQGGVPNMTLEIPRLDAYCLGEMFYFFQWAVAVSGYMLEVNPFNQPGVESYKKNMFALLGKPDFEDQTSEIRRVLSSRSSHVSGPGVVVRG